MCFLNVPTRTRGHSPSVLEHSHLTKIRGQPDGGSGDPLKPASTGCVSGPSQGLGPQSDPRATALHSTPPPTSVPAREFPVQNIMMLYSSFLLADVDSLDDKATLQSILGRLCTLGELVTHLS